MVDVSGILDGYDPEPEFAEAAKIGRRTSERYRAMQDGLPYVVFGGKIYIPREEAKEWLRSRIKHPNQRRKSA